MLFPNGWDGRHAMRQLIWLVAVAAIGAGVYFFVRGAPETELLLVGTVDGNDVVVSSQITARLESLRVREGDRVAAGQVLATLDQDELAAGVKAAAAASEQARRSEQVSQEQVLLLGAELPPAIVEADEQMAAARARQTQAETAAVQASASYQRLQALADRGLVTAQQLDDARAEWQGADAGAQAAERAVAAAAAALRMAEARRQEIDVGRRQADVARAAQDQAEAMHVQAMARLDRTTLFAPGGGVVSLLVARDGEVVTPGDAVLTIYELDDSWVQAYAPETYADRISLGQTLTVRLPSGVELAGEVFHKAVEADYATQRDISGLRPDIKTIGIRLRVSNTDGRLARGMTAMVVLPLDEGGTP